LEFKLSISKAFFINGGAGRVICSIPAFEKYEQESGDHNFIIVCEGGTELYKGHPTLDSRTYDIWHKNLFQDKLINMKIVSPEPYRIREYYTQQCNLTQAFDIEINDKGIRELPAPTLILSKDELITGRHIVNEVKEKLKKEKVVIFQPFGRGIQQVDNILVDRSGRSFELQAVKDIIKKLQKNNYGIVLMSEFKIDLTKEGFKDEIAMPENINLRQWAAVIKYADHFIGCDSVGQHLSYAIGKESTVVIGSTYPINISYPTSDIINVLDLGEGIREYSPIRITVDERIDRKNENLMSMNDEAVDIVIESVLGKTK